MAWCCVAWCCVVCGVCGVVSPTCGGPAGGAGMVSLLAGRVEVGEEGSLGEEAGRHRVYKSCNHAITQLPKIFENLRKIFENLCKFWTNERKTGRTGTNFMFFFCHNLTKFI